MTFELRPLGERDRAWIDELISARWGTPTVVSRGRVHRPSELAGFLAVVNEERVGLVTYAIEGGACEIVTIDSLVERVGIGSALVAAVAQAARSAGARRLWLIATNDNVPALCFYQKRGFSLVAVHRNAVDESRKLKPEIPPVGLDGVPIRDELELELEL